MHLTNRRQHIIRKWPALLKETGKCDCLVPPIPFPSDTVQLAIGHTGTNSGGLLQWWSSGTSKMGAARSRGVTMRGWAMWGRGRAARSAASIAELEEECHGERTSGSQVYSLFSVTSSSSSPVGLMADWTLQWLTIASWGTKWYSKTGRAWASWLAC